MLILSRKETEQIVIGDDIIVTIERINGKQVKVSITAPPEVNIVRGELLEMKGESDVKNR
jgi:carbon storage regulator